MHNITVRGHALRLTTGIRRHIETKVAHVLHHVPEALRVDVTITKEGHSPAVYEAKGHVLIWGPDMHVTGSADDLYMAIDNMCELLDRMARRKHRYIKVKRHFGAEATA